MYIDYAKLAKIFGSFKTFLYGQKFKQNLAYIKKNKKNMLKKLKGKSVFNVVFYVYDSSKWKSQSVYDLMAKDKRFCPKIVVTKNCSKFGNPNFQTKEDIKKCYDFFKNKEMNVELGYDIEKDEYIPLEKFNPDLVFYSHPWYVYKTQGPVVCSKFALTYYIPYFLPASEQWHEYGLRFHSYLYRQYVPTEKIKEYYSQNMDNKGESLRVVGHPIFDELREKSEQEKKYIIYAPHWTVCGNNLRFGTFDWSGKEVLEFAKNHQELNWIFRPHPLFYNFVKESGFLEEKELDKYFEEWKNIGQLSEGGDYIQLFQNSCAMITDCGSFLTEYFATSNPVIHLISKELKPNSVIEDIDKTYYCAHNNDELKNFLQEVIINKNDYKKNSRQELLDKMNLILECSAKRIIDDILKDIG